MSVCKPPCLDLKLMDGPRPPRLRPKPQSTGSQPTVTNVQRDFDEIYSETGRLRILMDQVDKYASSRGEPVRWQNRGWYYRARVSRWAWLYVASDYACDYQVRYIGIPILGRFTAKFSGKIPFKNRDEFLHRILRHREIVRSEKVKQWQEKEANKLLKMVKEED